MAISIDPKLRSGKNTLEHILSFRDSTTDAVYYQETSVPFMFVLMSIHPDSPAENAISIFTPESQFNTSAASIKGRSKGGMHQHNYFEFTYVLRGNMYQLVEGKRYLYTPGCCCLMNRSTLHTEELSTDFVCIFFSISPEFIERLRNYGHPMLFPEENRSFDNLIFQFLERNTSEHRPNAKDFLDFVPRITESEQKVIVHDIFEKMLAALLTPYHGATYRLLDLFFQLINILCDPDYYTISHVTVKSNIDSLLFARIDQLLDEHQGRISTKELARMLNYDGSYLGRIVKKQTGRCLYDYSLTFTMKAAANLLKNTKKSVSDIAATLRFANRTHFYKKFYEYYQMTPVEYRDYTSKQK